MGDMGSWWFALFGFVPYCGLLCALHMMPMNAARLVYQSARVFY
jgi:hypothetical protein